MLGPTLNEVDFNSLEPRMNLLKKEDIDVFTQQIQQKIKELNAKLTQGEILTEASREDPVGYVCQKQILNITEVHFVEKVHCYNTTEEVCSLVKVAKSQGSIFSLVLYLKKNFLSAMQPKDWPAKKVTIYFPIFYLVKSSENILFFYLHFT